MKGDLTLLGVLRAELGAESPLELAGETMRIPLTVLRAKGFYFSSFIG